MKAGAPNSGWDGSAWRNCVAVGKVRFLGSSASYRPCALYAKSGVRIRLGVASRLHAIAEEMGAILAAKSKGSRYRQSIPVPIGRH
jgi:hypothetical protein